MGAREIVIYEVGGDRVGVGLTFFDKPLVRRVKWGMCMRMVRFCRSANDVLTCLGLFSMVSFGAPVHSTGAVAVLSTVRRRQHRRRKRLQPL